MSTDYVLHVLACVLCSLVGKSFKARSIALWVVDNQWSCGFSGCRGTNHTWFQAWIGNIEYPHMESIVPIERSVGPRLHQ